MSTSFHTCAALIDRLHSGLSELEQQCGTLQLESPGGREWHQLLEQKLLPQIGADSFLVAAVVGGTNIGKSVMFNHLAGSNTSATSPLASGTKHPVCLIPPGFENRHDLAQVFPGFQLLPWESADAALNESEEDFLFWKHGESLPENLLVLDSPDIDSDARVNWERADRIRRCADVLIAVLTQQKYNDAAVKEFFRRAAAEDKYVLTVFNQVHLPDDENYWPLWMKTFCDETEVRPECLYLAQHDRKAADSNELQLLERRWPHDPSAIDSETDVAAGQHAGHRLSEDLATLRFGEIKIRTLRSSMDLLLSDDGVPEYLSEIRSRSEEFRSAAELLATHKLAEIESWPTIPNAAIVNEIRTWWQSQREGWSATVHGFYNRVGDGLKWTYQRVRQTVGNESKPPLDEYRDKEWEAMLDAVDDVYSRLNWFRELGNPLLQPRLEQLLGATTRQELIDRLRAAHAEADLEPELADLIRNELESFRDESPDWYRSLRRLDAVAAAARPATSIVLFVTGFGPFGHAVGSLATETAVTSAVSVAGDVAAGGLTATIGETWISNTASTGAAWLEARFRRIHEQFTSRRAAWLAKILQENLLGSLPEELGQAAMVPESAAFQAIEQTIKELRDALDSIDRRSEPQAENAAM